MSYKICKSESSQKVNTRKMSSYFTRNADNINLFNIRHNFYKNCFFSSTIIEWNNLDCNFWSSKIFGIFMGNILIFLRELDWSHDFAYVIYVSTNSSSISKIVNIRFAVGVRLLNRPLNLFYFLLVLNLMMKPIPSWAP